MGEHVGGRAGLLINAQSRLGLRAESVAAEALEPSRPRSWSDPSAWHAPRHLAQEADELLGLNLDRLIVGGGDGTISTVAPRLAGRGTALGVLPLGTANDFARTLQIPSNLEAAAEVAAGDHVVEVDLARANDAYFLNVASIGMSVSAMDAALAHDEEGPRPDRLRRGRRPGPSSGTTSSSSGSRARTSTKAWPTRSSSPTAASTAAACSWRRTARSTTVP